MVPKVSRWRACPLGGIYTAVQGKFKFLFPQWLLGALPALNTATLTCLEQGLPCAVIPLVVGTDFSQMTDEHPFLVALQSSALQYSLTELWGLQQSQGLCGDKGSNVAPQS